MELPNQHFQDFPIEFKEINPSDFPEFEVENNEKIIIEPNAQGFINDAFQTHIVLRHKNTVVVNASVGQGKSTAIIRTIEKYYNEHPDTVIVVASPYVSLVKQYCDDIHFKANIPESQIFNYGKIGRELDIDYKTRRIHVATVNALLGNPGDNAFKNSDEKRQYLNTLISHCTTNNLKVVFIYDEIHDAIQNFKEEFIFNLWKWKDIILKNYILSATYNEASKVVIEYLSELTDKKIQIIESKRIVFPDKQSRLYLHYNPALNYKATNPELIQIVKNLIRADKMIDILCYSKKLAKNIMSEESEIGKLLIDKYGEINDCTSELEDNSRQGNEEPKNIYDNNKCNVGTNFKTGVSIIKSNHAFIIIMPPEGTKMKFSNYFGIFSDGINSVIQALARQRTREEIHILLPEPYKFNYSSLTNSGCNEHQISIFKKFYDEVVTYRTTNTIDYLKLNTQDDLISRYYNEELYGHVSNEITHINSLERQNLAPLRYPPYKQFKLNRGEEYLSSKFYFFGKDISSYLTYCAFTNQFVNCRLTGLNTRPVLYFEEGKIQRNLIRLFEEYFKDEENLMPHFNFNHFYIETRTKLFNSFKLKIKSDVVWNDINPYNRIFENQLIRFCANQYFKDNYYYSRSSSNRLRDIEYTRDTYFLECISVANTIDLNEVNYSEEQKNKIKAYQNLNSIRNVLIQKIGTHSRGSTNFSYLPIKLLEGFLNPIERSLFDETITLLIESDDFVKNDIFNFRRNIISTDSSASTLHKKVESLYKMLVDDFFEIQELGESGKPPRIIINESKESVKRIISIKVLPDPSRVIDTLQADPLIEFANQHHESFEAYQDKINRLLTNTGY
ncbi:DEAD/DEAH box helicase [Flavobacterium sp. MDT1-60]|uniref:DEAD/DEAH box helicase n=1 Tax=Flavobacterium sp. MDT1-60 TaxID=1979344 RepID=UPI001785BCA0|nr:DEAD/DEAH box helicase [Flavobacterium sp. MDT1-60]QOG02290.1 DEAD/DEAH box helicase family protein [Flavobacterium sp. MDT1-60]